MSSVVYDVEPLLTGSPAGFSVLVNLIENPLSRLFVTSTGVPFLNELENTCPMLLLCAKAFVVAVISTASNRVKILLFFI